MDRTHSYEGEVKCLQAVEHERVVCMRWCGELEHRGANVRSVVMEYLGKGELYSYVVRVADKF
jgi:hypothetical protein